MPPAPATAPATTPAPKGQWDRHGRLVEHADASGQAIHYIYKPDGTLVEARVEGVDEPHRFETDKWGRIIKHQRPDGAYRSWQFDDRGLLVRIESGEPLAQDRADLFAKRRYRTVETLLSYDKFGRLTGVRRQSGDDERYIYDAHRRLRLAERANGKTRQYQYDRVGHVIERRTGDGLRERFRYHPDGSLAEHTLRPPHDASLCGPTTRKGN